MGFSSDEEDPEETPSCPPKCSREKAKRFCTTWNIYWKALVWFALVSVYLLVGGALFMAAERPNEQDEIDEARRNREVALNFLQATFVNLSNGTLTEEEAITLVNDLVVFFDNLEEDPAESNPQWEYAPAVFFATTVITTIGYGNIAPETDAGRALFVFYAFFGIPLTLVFLVTLGQILSGWLDQALAPIVHRYPKHASTIRITGLVGAGFLGTVVFLFIPAAIFERIESWTYGDALYYCVVTLTTVGFGDFVPAQKDGSLYFFYRLCSAAWIWFGLAYIALVISETQNLMERISNKVREKRRKSKSITADEEGMEVGVSEEPEVTKVELEEPLAAEKDTTTTPNSDD